VWYPHNGSKNKGGRTSKLMVLHGGSCTTVGGLGGSLEKVLTIPTKFRGEGKKSQGKNTQTNHPAGVRWGNAGIEQREGWEKGKNTAAITAARHLKGKFQQKTIKRPPFTKGCRGEQPGKGGGGVGGSPGPEIAGRRLHLSTPWIHRRKNLSKNELEPPSASGPSRAPWGSVFLGVIAPLRNRKPKKSQMGGGQFTRGHEQKISFYGATQNPRLTGGEPHPLLPLLLFTTGKGGGGKDSGWSGGNNVSHSTRILFLRKENGHCKCLTKKREGVAIETGESFSFLLGSGSTSARMQRSSNQKQEVRARKTTPTTHMGVAFRCLFLVNRNDGGKKKGKGKEKLPQGRETQGAGDH